VTCKRLADIGIQTSHLYKAFDEGSQDVILIFCEFTNGSRIGHSFLSPATLTSHVDITPHYNMKDHVMLRYLRDGIQYESKIEVLPLYRSQFNVSVFNSKHPDFTYPEGVAIPYLYLGFIPISFGDHHGILKGYACNGKNYTFINGDTNPNNFFVIYHSENIEIITFQQTNIRDGWKVCSKSVESSRFIPNMMMFNSYDIGMGGGGCRVRNDDESIKGITFGLPFDY
jgi:hypothetical protein